MPRGQIALLAGLALLASGKPARTQEPLYLADHPSMFVYASQGWGAMGINTCAHGGATPLPIQIGDRTFARGIGHHAPGEIIIETGGAFVRFEALVGVQRQAAGAGSVRFQVFVDGRKRFDSGVMRERDGARPVSVDLAGADELRLALGDGGDGITCDCGNWAEARLVPAASATARRPGSTLNVAPFAIVTSSDADRTHGVGANRIQAITAEDLRLDRRLVRRPDGWWSAPASRGAAAVGLIWPEKRRLRQLSIEVGGAMTGLPRVEVWLGESLWQGEWTPAPGALVQEGSRFRFVPEDPGPGSAGVRKVRWILPTATVSLSVGALEARIPAQLFRTRLTLFAERALPDETLTVSVRNGALSPTPAGTGPDHIVWRASRPLTLEVLAMKPRRWNPIGTVLTISGARRTCSVAIGDLMNAGVICVPECGLAARTGSTTGFDFVAARRRIASRPGVLDRVRAMPEQTLDRSMRRTHNPIQALGPALLSLACHNTKFVAPRDGGLQFESQPWNERANAVEPLVRAFTLSVSFAGASARTVSRRLEGGWLPAPVTAVLAGGVTYRQRALVLPAVAVGPALAASMAASPLAVVDLSADAPAQGRTPAITLAISGDGAAGARVDIAAGRALIIEGDRVVAICEPGPGATLMAGATPATMRVVGTSGAPFRCRVLAPGWRLPVIEASALRAPIDALGALRSYWEAVLAPAARIGIPDDLLANVARASQVNCLMAARNDGEGRVAAWIAAMSYGALESESHSIIRGMDLLGNAEFAARALDYFQARVSSEGLLTTGYTLVGGGWHLWTAAEHDALAADRAWLQRRAAGIERMCAWIADQALKTRASSDGLAPPGMMPPGVMADWNAFACHFALSGYYAAGLEQAAAALAPLDHAQASRFARAGADLRAATRRAFVEARGRTPVVRLASGAWTPGFPGQYHCPGPTGDYFPAEDGNRSWCYDIEIGAQQLAPQGVLDSREPIVGRLMDWMEDDAFLREGWFDYPESRSRRSWFDLGGFSKVQPYYTRNAEIYAMRDDRKPFLRSAFNALAAMLSPETLTLWEHFHNAGAWNKTHETGYFLQHVRWMLAVERSNGLTLNAMAPAAWNRRGLTTRIDRLPTRFGPVAYSVCSGTAANTIEARIRPPSRRRCAQLAIRLCHPAGRRIRSVTINGRFSSSFDGKRDLVFVPTGAPSIVVAQY